jgi:hypothetical protein
MRINVNMFASPGKIQDGIRMEGVVNPLIGHLHCQGMFGYCEHVGAGHVVFGGASMTHDVLDIAMGLADAGPAIDGNQTFISMSATGASQDIIFDERSNVHLTAATYNGEIAQYLLGGFVLNSHLNNTLANSANAGICTMASGKCTAINFVPAWNFTPACTATWTSGGTLTGQLQALATTSTLTIQSNVTTDNATVAYNCQGNPN